MDPMIAVLMMKARVVVSNRFRENDIMDEAVRHELRRRCTILGVIIHIVGSIGINIGQNLQALALANGVTNKCKSKMWLIGLGVFGVASIVTFGALALASASMATSSRSQLSLSSSPRQLTTLGRTLSSSLSSDGNES